MTTFFRSALPPNATSGEKALEQASSEPVIALNTSVVRQVKNADLCPEMLLPWLAWEFAVDFWEDSWSDKQKRQVIQDAAYIHQHRGTAGAVRRALSSIDVPSRVIEWWQEEPRAAPYTFRVEVYSGSEISSSLYEAIRRQTDKAKNLRSYLRSIDVISENGTEGTFYTGGAVTAVIDISIRPQGAPE